MKKDLIQLTDYSKEEIIHILDLADKLKKERKDGIPHKLLEGKSLAMIFSKSSTRTRVSFEAGIYQLGGQGMFLSTNDLQLGRGEPIKDTARVLSRYVDGIMIRTSSHDDVKELAKWASIPVINGLTDLAHPCQALADLMTIREHKGKLEGLQLTYIGDGNNVCNSLVVGALICGMKACVVVPKGYEPPEVVLEFTKKYPGQFKLTNAPKEGANKADVLYTDVWSSMGQESEAEERKKIFDGFQINKELLSYADEKAIVLHCLPAKRSEEITDEAMEAHAGPIFDEAENRLHAQKAVMALLMGQSV